MNTAEQIGRVIGLIILVLAGLFDPNHVAPGLTMFGPSEFLTLLGEVSGIIVVGYNVLFTMLAIAYLMLLLVIDTIPEEHLTVELVTATNRVASDPYIMKGIPIVLYAFMFATGFYYTGVIGLIVVILGQQLVAAAGRRIKHMSANDDLP